MEQPNAVKDCIIIDPWPEPLLREQYQRLREWIQSRRDLRQIVWASYESGRIDPLFADLVADPRSTGVALKQPLTATVWIAGQEWWRCVHARPLGIHQLVSAGYNIQVDLDMVWSRSADSQIWQSPKTLIEDAYQWQHQHDRQWLLEATARNRLLGDLHLSQQDN